MTATSTIYITGLGHISSLGQGVPALRAGLSQEKKPNIIPRTVTTAHGPRDILTYQCPDVVLPSSVPEPVQRRMSRIAKMCFAAVDEAMNDAFRGKPPEGIRMGIAVGTAFGAFELSNMFQKRIYSDGPTGASPSLFAGSVQNSIASALSMSFQIHGPSSTLMTMEQTAFGALRVASDWINQDVVDHAIVIIGDEISSYHSYALAHQTAPQKLIPQDDVFSAILGEGAIAFVLSRGSCANVNQYATLSDLQLRAQEPPSLNNIFVASCGLEGQHSRYQEWLKNRPSQSHSALFGSFLTGSAFEVAIAALDVASTGQPTACVQLTTHGEAQSLVLTKPI